MGEDIWNNAKNNAADIIQGNNWVQWIHEGTYPPTVSIDRKMNIILSQIISGKHCAKCMNINLCCFPRNNMPEYPLHPNCHCRIKPIDSIVAKAECRIEKFTEYAFNPFNKNGKKRIFEDLGYNKSDSKWLQQEFERQAKEKHESGNFILGELNDFVQRISITIALPQKIK